MGDAFCAFNPVYGQGIAVGVCEAVLVRDAINEVTPGGGRHLHRQFEKLVALPWSIASATDLQYPTCQQNPTRLGALQDNWTRQLEKLCPRQRKGRLRTKQRLPPHGTTTPTPPPGTGLGHSITGTFRGYAPASPRLAALPE